MTRLPLLLSLLLFTCAPAHAQESSPTDRDHIISIFFGGGSYYVAPRERARLKQFLDEIPNIEGYEIEIQGHTDDIGPREYNMRLSERRNQAVHRLLLAYPLPPEMMQLLPLGEDAPAYDNGTWDGKLSNRRVDVILKRILI